MESWHKTRFLLMGSSRGKDEHAAREEVKAHLQEAALVRGCFACRSQEAGPTGDWVLVWSGLTLLLGTLKLRLAWGEVCREMQIS